MDEFQNNDMNNQYGAPNQYNVPNNGMDNNQFNPGVTNGFSGDVNNVNNGMGFDANNPVNIPNEVNPNMVDPNMMDPNMVNPNGMEPNVMNPNMMDPNMMNPNMMDPNMQNPNMMDPNMQNPNVMNPNMMDSNMMNPSMDQNMQQNERNNSIPPKKSGKGLLVAIVIFFLIAVFAIVGLVLYSKDMLPFGKKESNVESNTVSNTVAVEDDTTVDEDDPYNCLIVTDFNTLPENHEFRERIDFYNGYKIAKVTGKVEGLFNIKNEDIYRIAVNTNDMMVYDSSAHENFAHFQMIDMNDNIIDVALRIIVDEREYKEIENGFGSKDDKGTELEYESWKYCLIDDGAMVYYPLMRYDDDIATVCFTIGAENFEYMTDKEMLDFVKKFTECVEIEFVEQAPQEDGGRVYSNMFSIVDLSNIVITDSIGFDLSSFITIEGFSNDNFSGIGDFSAVWYTCRANDNSYLLDIKEDKNMTLEEVKERYEAEGSSTDIWETCQIGDDEVLVFCDADKYVKSMVIPLEDDMITIDIHTGELMNDQRLEEYFFYDNALDHLGTKLFTGE